MPQSIVPNTQSGLKLTAERPPLSPSPLEVVLSCPGEWVIIFSEGGCFICEDKNVYPVRQCSFPL